MTDVYALDLYHFTVVDRLFILIIIQVSQVLK